VGPETGIEATGAVGRKSFLQQLLVEVLDHAEIEGQEAFVEDAFTDLILDDLESEGRWPDYQVSHYSARGAAVSAWAIDPTLRRLFLAISDFDRSGATETITRTEIDALFRRLAGFLKRSRDGRIEIEDHHPVADLVDAAGDTERYDDVTLYLLTHRTAPEYIPESPAVAGVTIQTRVWDLETIRRSRVSGERLEPIAIDFTADNGGLPCLAADRHDEVQTYLAYIPGQRLAEIYLEHGGRLLERNVRAFLSARGKINRGIRDTLRTEPERFLPYNNGITATAESIRLIRTDHGDVIEYVHDFQIVNGGQTTASLAVAARDVECDLNDVSVQMKLVVVGPELIDELVPNISRYANRQNNVQESDLSANNDYLRRMDESSRTEWTPAAAHGRPTKWYFERARGSYTVDQTSSGKASVQKRFLAEYPKDQKFGKNEIALYENTWSRLPHLVCRGGQKNFVEFMERLPEPPETDVDGWHRQRFRDLVSKAIIFKTADSTVRKVFGGTYKRQVVAYTLCYLFERSEHGPDLGLIWRTQQISDAFIDAISQVGEGVKGAIIETADGRNITEWTKQEACWSALRKIEFSFDEFAREVSLPAPSPAKVSAHGSLVPGNLSLADASRAAQGTAVEGRYRRYRRRRWRHLGDTGVSGSGRQTLHAYAAPMPGSDGPDYIFNVVVDIASQSITPVDELEPAQRAEVVIWLAESGFSS